MQIMEKKGELTALGFSKVFHLSPEGFGWEVKPLFQAPGTMLLLQYLDEGHINLFIILCCVNLMYEFDIPCVCNRATPGLMHR